MKTILPIALLFAVAHVATAAEHTEEPIDTVKAHVTSGKALLIDVREQNEWDAGHVEGAILLPLSQLQKGLTAEQRKLLPADKPIYVHCRSGRRCLSGTDVLKAANLDARALKPGYEDLIKAGFPKAE